MRAELSASYASSSKATRATCAALACGWFGRFALFGKSLDEYLALKPYSVMTQPWTLVTSGYYEMSLAALLVDASGLLYIGRALEPIWGSNELTRFVVGVNVAVATFSWLSMFALYILSGFDEFYLFAKFSGFHGVLAALLLALRQVLPEEPVFTGESSNISSSRAMASLRSIRNKHLIGTYLSFTALYAFMSGGRHHHIGLYLFDVWGAYSAWLYLRFFQPHGSGLRGDDSPDFAFAALFPPAARPVIARVSAPMRAAATRIAAARRRRDVTSDVESAPSSTPPNPKPSVSNAADTAVRAKLEKSKITVDQEDEAAKEKREKLAERGRAALEKKRSNPNEDGVIA